MNPYDGLDQNERSLLPGGLDPKRPVGDRARVAAAALPLARVALVRFVLVLAGVLLVGFLLTGCSEDSNRPPTSEAVAVFGYLYVGETINTANAIHIARVQPVEAYYDAGAAGLEDAEVSWYWDETGLDSPRPLVSIGGGRYVDPDSNRIEHVIAGGQPYALRVVLPDGRELTGRTITPRWARIDGGPPVAPETVRQEVLQDSYPVLVWCDDPDQVLLVDVYCLEDWEDARYINSFGPNDSPSSYDEYGGVNGEPRHIHAYFHAKDVVRRHDAYLVDFYGAMIAFYGRYQVTISAIDDNVYNFLYRDHPQEHGGIEGGIGVFGSAVRRSWTITIVE
jgi:hypothetical protein